MNDESKRIIIALCGCLGALAFGFAALHLQPSEPRVREIDTEHPVQDVELQTEDGVVVAVVEINPDAGVRTVYMWSPDGGVSEREVAPGMERVRVGLTTSEFFEPSISAGTWHVTAADGDGALIGAKTSVTVGYVHRDEQIMTISNRGGRR